MLFVMLNGRIEKGPDILAIWIIQSQKSQVFINKVATYVPYSKLFKKDFRNRVLLMKISPLKCLFIDKHS